MTTKDGLIITTITCSHVVAELSFLGGILKLGDGNHPSSVEEG